MKVVRCPRCGHENRAAISVSICDRCGADISTAPDLNARGDERDLRINPAEVVAAETPAAARAEQPRPEAPAAPPRQEPFTATRLLSLLGRMLLAAAALGLGIAGGLSGRLGNALGSDPQLAGSIAILAAASAIGGLVLILLGGTSDRSQSITWGLRSVGFLLATLGIWAVTMIANVAIHGGEAADAAREVGPFPTMPGPAGPPGMEMGPGPPAHGGAMQPDAGARPAPSPQGTPPGEVVPRDLSPRAGRQGPPN